jgi:hypothetical protein
MEKTPSLKTLISEFNDYGSEPLLTERNFGNLSSAARRRMDGLVKTASFKSYLKFGTDMADDLLEDGFEPEEVREFLASLIERIV